MTIIGMERESDGARNLLVFDPSFKDASGITKLVGRKFPKHPNPYGALQSYRRGNRYLKKYREFEVLRSVPYLHIGDLLNCCTDPHC